MHCGSPPAGTVAVAVALVRNLPQGSDAVAHHPATVVTACPVQLAGLGSSAAHLLSEPQGAPSRTLHKGEHP